MSGKSASKSSRTVWAAVHLGILAWVICLIILAEEHREGGDDGAASAEAPGGGSEAGRSPEDTTADAWTDQQVAALGDPVFGVRVKATRRLVAAGPRVIPRLSLALDSRDPEISKRAQTILASLIKSNDQAFLALEQIAGTPEHPAQRKAESILQRECDRRERILAQLSEQRKLDADRYLREARAAIYEHRFAQARQHLRSAEALDVIYGPYDDQPKLVRRDLQRAEAKAAVMPRPVFVTAERD